MYEIRQTQTYRSWEGRLRDQRALLAIANRIDRLAAGNFGDAKAVGVGISELRIHYGPGYLRR